MIVVVPYDQQWPHHFAKLGGRLREVLGEVALSSRPCPLPSGRSSAAPG
jgi:hypothetical protein